MDVGSRDAQIETMSQLKIELARRGSAVQLIADEWANTVEDIEAFAEAQAVHLLQIQTPDLGSVHHIVEAVAACKANGVGAIIGGTCAETDRSARATTHVGIATEVTRCSPNQEWGSKRGWSS